MRYLINWLLINCVYVLIVVLFSLYLFITGVQFIEIAAKQ